MFCQRCGAENPTEAKFCYQCGSSLLEKEPPLGKQASANPSEVPPQKHDENAEWNDTVCPFCQAADCQPMQRNTTEIKNSNYHWGQGCCGMFLMGPFGLLCGLCGTGSKMKSESALWWTCLKCGKQHLALADAKKKWEGLVNGLPVTGVAIGISAIIFKALLRWLLGYGFFASAIIWIAPIIYSIYFTYLGISEAEKEISQELGAQITAFLSSEEANNRLMKLLLAIGIALFITLFGLPLLDFVLGD